MSRGFVKEEDQEDLPMVPPRADLPMGTTNYVTVDGLNALLKEKEELFKEKEMSNISNENERRIAVNFINAKLQLLQERISTAQIVELSKQPSDEVRFGAWVTLKANDQKKMLCYQIVGVDEANIVQNKISFVAPLARLLINKKVGDYAILQLGAKQRIFEIVSIEYRF